MFPFFRGFRNRLAALFAGALSPAIASDAASPAKSEAGERLAAKGPKFAFVCLKSDRDPSVDVLRSKVAHWLKVKADEVKNIEATTDKGITAVSFEVGSRNVLIARAGIPIPKEEIEYACGNALLWPQASEVMANQKSHLIVTVFGEFASPVEHGLFLSRVIAACTEAYDALGVYWGHATVVHSVEFYREQILAAEDGRLPVLVWVGFLRDRGEREGTFNLYTRGLETFGIMEMEVIGTARKGSEVIGQVADLGIYLLKNGNVIKDGNTIGSDAGEKIRTRHTDSALDRGGKVLRIEL